MLDLTWPPAAPAGTPLADFCRQLGGYLAERVDPLAIDRGGAIPGAILLDLARLGVFGVAIPERWGGSGLGLAGACTVVDTLARRDRALATTAGLHLGLGTHGLVAYGNERQRERWLPDLAAGESIAAFSVTEPGAGSDLSRLQTRVTPGGPGRVVVDGHKVFVTNGGLASVLTVVAASPELGDAPAGASLVVLESRDAGVVVGAEEDKLGLRGSSTTPLYFNAVEVPEDRLLGPPGRGQELLGQLLAWGRTIMAAGCTGTAHAALELATGHVKTRRQFGRTLASQPVVRRQLTDMAVDLHAMRALVDAAAAAEHDPLLLERLSLAAKVFCSEIDWSLCDRALQLLGGSGYLEASGAPLLLRDARITRIFEGANDVLLTRIGSLELVRPRVLEPSGTVMADAIASEVMAIVAEWREARGLQVLRDAAELHWLGRLVVQREAAWAVAGAGTDLDASPLVWQALARIERATQVILLERQEASASELVWQQLFEETLA